MAKMRMFLRESTVGREPLAVSMSGVRPGERVVQIGVSDAAIVRAIGEKVGLTGLSTIVVPNETEATRVRSAIGEGLAAADVRVEPLDRLPFDAAVYDVAIVHNADSSLTSLDPAIRNDAMREWQRVLRPGGRVIVLDPGAPTGLRALLGGGAKRASQTSGSGTVEALQLAGFIAVRVLGDRQGYRFVEGLKSSR
jgi:SAM-dependent methyltransferase